MTLSVSGVNCAIPVSNVKATAISANNIHFKGNEDLNEDVVELTKSDLSTRDKQKMIKKARTKAAGWACFGGIFSTAYYGLRSNKKIAEKFGLDPVKDRDLVKQIKKEQTIWTLPGAFLPLAGAVIAYIIANNKNSNNIEVD